MSVFVSDIFAAAQDPKMPFLTDAIDPHIVQTQFDRHLSPLDGSRSRFQVQAIRVVRYKPGRRCLIEYRLGSDGLPDPAQVFMGKVRARGLDQHTHHLMRGLREAGFSQDSKDGISVPEPIGMIPEFNMCLQRKVAGVSAAQLLSQEGGIQLARRIAEAAHKLHRANLLARRRHTMEDELHILHERLPLVMQMEPRWSKRLERILEKCDRLGNSLVDPRTCGIHRDFYADQVLVDQSRLYLIDWDLYCQGDPGLDIGNFLGHLTEWSLRKLGDPQALLDRQQAMEERFVQLTGEAVRPALAAYATLTLVRHIHISSQFSDRRAFTELLLQLCEERLA